MKTSGRKQSAWGNDPMRFDMKITGETPQRLGEDYGVPARTDAARPVDTITLPRGGPV